MSSPWVHVDEECPAATCTGDRDWCAAQSVFDGGMDQDSFARDRMRQAQVKRLASSLSRHYSIPEHARDDALQVVWMAAMESVREPHVRDRYPSWVGYVKLRGQSAIRAWTESSEWTGTSGMTTVVRRRRALLVHRQRMQAAEPGRQFSDDELVDSFNARMAERRADMERQGMRAQVSDLHPLDAIELDETLASSDPVDGSGCPLVPMEAKALVARGIEVCDTIGLGGACRAMYAGGDVSTDREVATALGTTRARARAMMDEVESVMRQILADEFGIHSATG